MKQLPEEPVAWLRREDDVCREERTARLTWLASVLPSAEFLTFPGGWMAKCLFEEMRYCFVYGQYLATITLGFAYIERSLAAAFFTLGRDDLERANIASLVKEAIEYGIISSDEADELDRIRRLRNPVTHFRKPLDLDGVETRALEEAQHPYDILEEDARTVVQAAMSMLGRNAT